MSRPYASDEQYERWYMIQCCRCGRRRNKAGAWPDGYVCRTCCDRAVRVRGTCPGCGQDRVLPGRRPSDGTAICTTCAGFSQSLACSRCGVEDKLHAGRLCTRCTFADRLAEILDDGTGRIHPELAPLAEHLLAMNNSLTGLTWLYPRKGRPGPADLLRGLSRGEIELTHEAFHTLQPWRAAAHLRELLMACGLLPPVDKQICSFERWLLTHLAGITDPDHAQIVQRFATWHVLPRLRAQAEKKPITPGSRCHAGDQVKRATDFLQWLSARGLTLTTCRQADIDTWHTEHTGHTQGTLRTFLRWCAASRLTSDFRLPAAVTGPAPTPLPEHHRLDLLGRMLTNHDLPLRSRVAAAIVLLYAQPLSRIVRLTIDDVLHDGDQVFLRLGTPPSPVPDPVADLLLAWVDKRDNMNTATNRDSRWLFPGRRANQPMQPRTLENQFNALGVPTTAGRSAAIRQHLLDTPAPIIAEALGYHHVTTAKLAAQAGVTWSRYTPGDGPR